MKYDITTDVRVYRTTIGDLPDFIELLTNTGETLVSVVQSQSTTVAEERVPTSLDEMGLTYPNSLARIPTWGNDDLPPF